MFKRDRTKERTVSQRRGGPESPQRQGESESENNRHRASESEGYGRLSSANRGTGRRGDAPNPSDSVASGVTVRDLTRTFKIPRRREKVHALAEVSLDLAPGSFTAIVGASGSGKSTLMLCVAGLDQPTSGTVTMSGVETSGLGRRERASFRAENVGFIFQDGNLVSSLSARDNIALPGQLRHKPLPRGAVREALERVGLSDQARRMPSELSGGERQRVAVARVLASKPAVIFADEPTAALDVGAGEQVLAWLREAANEGSSVLMVTHDAQAAARADRVLVMNAGRIAGELPGGDAQMISEAVLSGRTGGHQRADVQKESDDSFSTGSSQPIGYYGMGSGHEGGSQGADEAEHGVRGKGPGQRTGGLSAPANGASDVPDGSSVPANGRSVPANAQAGEAR